MSDDNKKLIRLDKTEIIELEDIDSCEGCKYEIHEICNYYNIYMVDESITRLDRCKNDFTIKEIIPVNLERMLHMAFKSEEYMITITHKKKAIQKGKDDLQHYTVIKDFEKDDVIVSLDHLQSEFAKKNYNNENKKEWK